jgi:hypothetical protein
MCNKNSCNLYDGMVCRLSQGLRTALWAYARAYARIHNTVALTSVGERMLVHQLATTIIDLREND